MKGLTLWQPYASLIGIGAKSIETRGWGTAYRGPLLIHAAKRADLDIVADCGRAQAVLSRLGFEPASPHARRLARRNLVETLGRALAVATLADCRPMFAAPSELDGEFGHFGPGRHGWVLEDVRPLPEPIPWKGGQGLWSVPPELLHRVHSALEPGPAPSAPPRDLPGQALLF